MPHDGGTDTPTGRKNKIGTPKNRAKAAEAQDPDPEPRKGDAQGHKPAGHAADGKETHKPEAAAHALTHAEDRAAKRAGKGKDGKAATENTEAAGKHPRTAASTPEAQPTKTGAPTRTNPQATETAAGTTEREPEKPKAPKPEKTEAKPETQAATKHHKRGKKAAAHDHHRTSKAPTRYKTKMRKTNKKHEKKAKK